MKKYISDADRQKPKRQMCQLCGKSTSKIMLLKNLLLCYTCEEIVTNKKRMGL